MLDELQDIAKSLGRNLSKSDAEIAASGILENANVITRDKKFLRFLQDAGGCGKIPITGETF